MGDPPARGLLEPIRSMSVVADRGALAFAEKLLGLLGQGSFSATYKYAVILGLMDLCLEQSARSGAAPSMVTTKQLAMEVVELYWPHTLPFSRDTVLLQNSGRQAKILWAPARSIHSVWRKRLNQRHLQSPSRLPSAVCGNA